MIADRGRLSDGFTTLVSGMDSGRKTPSSINSNQCSYSENITFRGGFAKTRPSFKRLKVKDATTDTSDAYAFLNNKFKEPLGLLSPTMRATLLRFLAASLPH